MFLSAHISSHWRELEQNSTQSYMKLKESFDKMLEERKMMNALTFLLNVSWRWRYNKVNEIMLLSFRGDIRPSDQGLRKLMIDFAFMYTGHRERGFLGLASTLHSLESPTDELQLCLLLGRMQAMGLFNARGYSSNCLG